MFYKIGESDGNLYVGCEFCHTEIILTESMCRKRGIYYTISKNMICPKCEETSNRIIDEPGIRNAMELKKKELEEAQALKAKKLLNKKIIESESSILLADSEIKLILYNFINKLDFSFLNISSFVVFERLIIKHNNIGELSLLCGDHDLSHYLVYNDIFDGFQQYTSLKLIHSEFNEKFLRLVKIIEKKTCDAKRKYCNFCNVNSANNAGIGNRVLRVMLF